MSLSNTTEIAALAAFLQGTGPIVTGGSVTSKSAKPAKKAKE